MGLLSGKRAIGLENQNYLNMSKIWENWPFENVYIHRKKSDLQMYKTTKLHQRLPEDIERQSRRNDDKNSAPWNCVITFTNPWLPDATACSSIAVSPSLSISILSKPITSYTSSPAASAMSSMWGNLEID